MFFTDIPYLLKIMFKNRVGIENTAIKMHGTYYLFNIPLE